MEPVNIPQRLKELRQAAGISQRTAARAAGVRSSTWSQWETGNMHPRLHRAADIARALDAPICALTAQPDETPIADITLTARTLERVRQGGRPAAAEVALELAAALTPVLHRASTYEADSKGRGSGAGHPLAAPRMRGQAAKARIEAKQRARSEAQRLRAGALASEAGGEGANG